ncbi:Nucleotide cyclase [Hyaloscypha variabilis]
MGQTLPEIAPRVSGTRRTILTPPNSNPSSSRTSSRNRTPASSPNSTMGNTVPEIAAPFGPMCCVFTDVVDSTALWEYNSREMWDALADHNSLIRPLINDFRGYEIKTTGDGFHLAFQNAMDALKFCLSVQISICTHDWAQAILDFHRQPKQVEKTKVALECLAVRTGIYFGMPDFTEINPLSQRMDYYGPMVNRSARVAGLAEAGEVAVSDNFIREIWRIQTRGTVNTTGELTDTTRTRILRKVVSSEFFALEFMGWVSVKGVDEEMYTTLICCPTRLEETWGSPQTFPDSQT